MHLEKYYVDVVRPDGSGCIGYAARLGGLAATIAATLEWTADPGQACTQHRTLRGRRPAAVAAGLTWECAALEIAGRWTTAEPAHAQRVLWSDARGAVRWQVLAPRARVEGRLHGRPFSGWGYAEKLTVDIAPWHLPIDALRWGRFVAPTHSVVWIDWAHATPHRWVWHNGLACEAPVIAPTGVSWRDGRLDFGVPRTLRTGRLAATVFARWPGLQRLLPPRLLALDESKWCVSGILTLADRSAASGRVIHEHVRLR